MEWQDKYLSSNIERDKFRFKKVWREVSDFWELFVHAISFHKSPKEPYKELPKFKSQDEDVIYNVCKDFYQSANDRIDKIEDKAIKVLSYVTILFAIISFAFLNTALIVSKTILLFSMLFLLLAILISFRCVNIKGRKVSFLPDVYDFQSDPPIDNFNKKHIAKKLLNSAIYNQSIADNTADILKAARYMLTIAFVISSIAFIIGINGYFNNAPKTNVVKIDNQLNLTEVENRIDKTNSVLDGISKNMDKSGNSRELNDKIDALSKELNSIKSDYNNLLKKVDDLEKREENNESK